MTAPPPVQVWPGAVLIQGSALQASLEAVIIASRHRRLSGYPTSRIYAELAAAFQQASMAATRHIDVAEPPGIAYLPSVTVEEAAKRMGKSRRQVQRQAPKLGGRLIGGRWLLDEQAITEHMEGLKWTGLN